MTQKYIILTVSYHSLPYASDLGHTVNSFFATELQAAIIAHITVRTHCHSSTTDNTHNKKGHLQTSAVKEIEKISGQIELVGL